MNFLNQKPELISMLAKFAGAEPKGILALCQLTVYHVEDQEDLSRVVAQIFYSDEEQYRMKQRFMVFPGDYENLDRLNLFYKPFDRCQYCIGHFENTWKNCCKFKYKKCCYIEWGLKRLGFISREKEINDASMSN